ncbi:MAG: rhamnulokinase family protein [Planctomycetota bacterium]
MSDSRVHLAVDLGASSGRVIAGVTTGRTMALETIHRFDNEAVRVQDSLQWDVVGLWREILTGLRMASEQYDSIASVGVDTWGVDFVLLSSQDLPAGPVRSYRDARNRGMVEKAFEIVPRDEIFAATGLQFMDINTVYQLLAAVQAGDPSVEFADGFLMMGDFFHWLLTGRRSIEATNASTTQLLDPRTNQWRFDLIERFGIPKNWFIDPTEPGASLGNVQPSVAAQTGLEDVPVIVPATHDTGSAVLAVPAADFAPASPSWCYISSGTWSLMGCELPEPKINPLCAELNFTNEGGVGGSTRLLKNIGGLWIFQQMRKAMERRGREKSWEEMVSAAERANPFALLVNPDDPSLVAPDDMIDAVEALARNTGQTPPNDDGVFYRAALEGLALRYRACLQMLESLTENSIETIHIVGGGSLNELLCQMTADACNRTVVAGPVEATAIGNVLMQMMGTGALESVEAGRTLVRSSFPTTTYKPQDADAWTEPARRFAEL